MWQRAVLVACITLAALGVRSGVGHTQGAPSGTWLEAPLTNWNAPGMALPAAPSAATVSPLCVGRGRPPESAADQQLAERGWTLFGAYQAGWGITVVRAGAAMDGMCRPLQYNVFVFHAGQFVGTVSPELMDSRTTGQEAGVTLLGPLEAQGPVRLTARFLRYAPNDPLCCPSLPAAVVTYEVQRAGGGDVLVPLSKEPG
jgi:hypothetical protein